MPFGKSGKQYFNPKVMEAHGDGPDGQHPHIHHVEIHPHGESSEHPHHVEVHHHDGTMVHGGEHNNFDEAAAAAKSHVDGIATDESPAEEQEEEKISPGIHEKVRKSESGAY